MFISVGADTREGEAGLDRIIGKQRDLVGQSQKTTAGTEALGNAVRNFIGGAAVGQAINMVGQLSAAYNEQQSALARLKTAVVNTGASYAAEQGRINAQIEAGKKLAFADQDTAASLSVLINSTGDLDEALKRQKVAMDFAVGAHIDLYTASRLLGRVTDENVMFLRRYGVMVDKNATSVEVLNKVEQIYAGQAKSRADSSLGATLKVQNAINDLKATLGGAVSWMAPFTTAIQMLGVTNPAFSGGIGLLVGKIGAVPKALQAIGAAALGMGASQKLAATYTGDLVAALSQSGSEAAAAAVPYTAVVDGATQMSDAAGGATEALGNLGSSATITSTALDISKLSKGARAIEGIGSASKLAAAGMGEAAAAGAVATTSLGSVAVAETAVTTASGGATVARAAETTATGANVLAAEADTVALTENATAYAAVGLAAGATTTAVEAETAATVVNAAAQTGRFAKLAAGLKAVVTPSAGGLAGIAGLAIRLGVLGAAGVGAAAGLAKVGASIVDTQARVGTHLVTDIPILGGIVRGLSDASDAMGMFKKLVEDRGPLDALGAIKDQITRSLDPLQKYKDSIQQAKDRLDALKNTNVQFAATAGAIGTAFQQQSQQGTVGDISGILGGFGVKPDDAKMERIQSILLGFNGVPFSEIGKVPKGLINARDILYKQLEPILLQRAGAQRGNIGSTQYSQAYGPLSDLYEQIKKEGGVRSKTLAEIAKSEQVTPQVQLQRIKETLDRDKTEFDQAWSEINQIFSEGLADAGNDEQEFKDESLKHVHEVRDAWMDLKQATDDYSAAVEAAKTATKGFVPSFNISLPTGASPDDYGTLTPGPTGPDRTKGGFYPGKALGGFIEETQPYLMHKGEYVLRTDEVDAIRSARASGGGGGSPVNVSLTLNYNGSASSEDASRFGNDILDVVTEGLRMQNRRVGNRASPFGVAV